MNMSAKQLRKILRSRRQSLSAAEREAKSVSIARNLVNLLPFRRAQKIAFYMATSEEVDTTEAIELAVALGKSVFLPVINEASWRPIPLLFHEYRPLETRLINNRYGIPEPEHRGGTPLRAKSLDLICAPLVGFNANCDRIGMGAGYYDRILAKPGYRKTHFIGLAFACQRAEFTPADHDVPMDAIITEDEIIQRSKI